jgi:DNA-binding transcriptional LysR family regulator
MEHCKPGACREREDGTVELHYLGEFVELAHTGNYQEAAANLFVSQSSLSKHIKSLETELGISLFDRTTRSVRLSADGECFLPFAVRIVQVMEDYRGILMHKAYVKKNRLAIASTPQMVQYSITDALAQYKRHSPSCQLDVLVEPHKNLKKLLRAGKADYIWIGESTKEKRDSDFERVSFLSEPLVVLVPSGHPLAACKTVGIGQLQHLDIVMQDNSSIEQEVFVSFCRKNDVEPNITSIPGSGVGNFVTQGLGVGVLLRTPAENIRGENTVLIEIENSPIVDVNLLYMKCADLSPEALTFLAFIKNIQNAESKNN